MTKCVVWGGLRIDGSPSHAARIGDSMVSMFDCEMLSVDGSDSMLFSPATAGGDGIWVHASTLHCENTSILAGDGGNSGSACQGADGGSAVVLTGASTLRTMATTLVGGQGGTSGAGCNPGANGLDVDLGDGTWLPFAATPRTLDGQALLRVNDNASLRIAGEPGDFMTLSVGLALDPAIYPNLDTPFLLSGPSLLSRVVLGIAPASGEIDLPFVVPPLGIPAISLFLQAAVIDPTPKLRFGEGRHLMLLE